MASTSCASHLSNFRGARSGFLSSEKVQGPVSFVSLRRGDRFKPQAAVMAARPTDSSTSRALVYEPLLHRLAPVEKNETENWGDDERQNRDPITYENLDAWIMDSVTEIVKNIGEAPFLVQVFSREGRAKELRLERETATPDDWAHIKKRWSPKRSRPTPDGIILVNELREDLEEEQQLKDESSSSYFGSMDGLSQVWGVVAQGRGMECVACYILNTCRVYSPAGCCTHFCLIRAECSGDPIDVQLRNVWLQSRRR